MRKWDSSHLRLTPMHLQAYNLEGLEVLITVKTTGAMNFTGLGSFQHLLAHSHLLHFIKQLCLIYKSPVQVNILVHKSRRIESLSIALSSHFSSSHSAHDERAEGEKGEKNAKKKTKNDERLIHFL